MKFELYLMRHFWVWSEQWWIQCIKNFNEFVRRRFVCWANTCRRLYIPCRTEFVWKTWVTDSILGEYMVDARTSNKALCVLNVFCHLMYMYISKKCWKTASGNEEPLSYWRMWNDKHNCIIWLYDSDYVNCHEMLRSVDQHCLWILHLFLFSLKQVNIFIFTALKSEWETGQKAKMNENSIL